MIKFLVFPLLATASLLLADISPSYPPNPNDTTGGKLSPAFSAANAAAIAWINLLDQQQYGGAWLDAGSLLKEVITENQWIAAMQGTRQSLGAAYTRKVASHQTTQELPFGTRGNFIIVKYDTSFYGKAGYTETVTLISEGAYSEWKVMAYQVSNR